MSRQIIPYKNNAQKAAVKHYVYSKKKLKRYLFYSVLFVIGVVVKALRY